MSNDPIDPAAVADNIVDFTPEKHKRVLAEAERLARQGPIEYPLWIDSRAAQLDIPVATLKAMVVANIKDIEKKKRAEQAEIRRQEDRVRKDKLDVQRQQKRDQEVVDKAAERKAKDKVKAFVALAKLPTAQHEGKLVELAKRLEEDVALLREEFAEFAGGGGAEDGSATPASWDVEPWGEPVKTQALLQDLSDQVRGYMVLRPEALTAVVLWTAMSWTHDAIATHSPYLVATSAEPDSGKTTLLGVLYNLVPKPLMGAEPTGANIYRLVDREHPTLIIDEADDLFARRSDIKHIFNSAWTRGVKIPRQVQGRTHWFDPFCPKAIGLLGAALPKALASRCVQIKLWPKTLDEKVADFGFADDEEFLTLRRKLARWATDNAAAIKDTKPAYPPGFGNRKATNWKLLLAIATHAGGDWPKRAQQAAAFISRTSADPSLGVQLLAALQVMFSKHKVITSEEIVQKLHADLDGAWNDYRGHPISKHEVAGLLKPFDIRPIVVHPTKRSSLSPRGYKVEQFADVFARYLPKLVHIRTSSKGGK